MAKKQPELALSVGVRSERGRREDNQDKMSAFSTPLGMVYIVADGMGGYRGGAEASRRVVEGFQRALNNSGPTENINSKELLQRAAQQTNAEILAASNSGDPAIEGMGSTVVLVLLRSTPTGMQMMAAHIGDSRAYLLREGVLYRITRDHSMVQRMVDTGLLTPEQAHRHPDSNVLSRAIGKQAAVEIETGETFALLPGDTVMLCSDGLWGPLTDAQVAEVLGRGTDTQTIADALVDLAFTQGSDDNITVQVLRFGHRPAHKGAFILGSMGRRRNTTLAPAPPGFVSRYDAAPPRPSSGRRQLKPLDYVFGALAILLVAALAVIGYQGLRPKFAPHGHPSGASPAPAPVLPAVTPPAATPASSGASPRPSPATKVKTGTEKKGTPQQLKPAPPPGELPAGPKPPAPASNTVPATQPTKVPPPPSTSSSTKTQEEKH